MWLLLSEFPPTLEIHKYKYWSMNVKKKLHQIYTFLEEMIEVK